MVFRLQAFSLFFFCLFSVSVFAGPIPAVCEHPKVRVRSAPTVEGSRITGQLNEGDELFILEERTEGDSYPWYRIQALESPVYGWVYGKFVQPSGGEFSPVQTLAWQVLLDFGSTTERAHALFGKPEKVRNHVLESGKKEKQLIFYTHSAVYLDNILVRVIVEGKQQANFGKYRIGSPVADLLELSRRYVVDYDSLIFLNEQHDEFRFDIEDEKIVAMTYFRATAD